MTKEIHHILTDDYLGLAVVKRHETRYRTANRQVHPPLTIFVVFFFCLSESLKILPVLNKQRVKPEKYYSRLPHFSSLTHTLTGKSK